MIFQRDRKFIKDLQILKEDYLKNNEIGISVFDSFNSVFKNMLIPVIDELRTWNKEYQIFDKNFENLEKITLEFYKYHFERYKKLKWKKGRKKMLNNYYKRLKKDKNNLEK